jgi:atypical dual specificity phosphatase
MNIDWIELQKLAAGPIPLGARDIRSLHDQGIRAVLSLTENSLWIQREITPMLFRELDMTYLHEPIPDGCPPDLEAAQRIIQHINDSQGEGRTVFVHCHAGIGRTGTVLHLYYLAHGLSLDQAKIAVRRGRSVCSFLNLTSAQQAFVTDFASKHAGV